MKKLKKVISRTFLGLMALIVGIYSILLIYIYYTDSTEVKIINNVKSVYTRHNSPHKISLLSKGIDSLNSRVQLIRNAKQSIELEFFIYNLDDASKYITNELIKASKRGVKVKILVDFSVAVFKLAPIYTNYLKEQGIDVRYYNTISNTNLIMVQHRNHRKLLIVDEKELITGGRNIANEYFDLSDTYNFLDFDIRLEGSIVKDIRESFYNYWESSYTTVPDIVESQIDADFFSDKAMFKSIESKFGEMESESFICNDIAYSTDRPGVLVSNRQVYKRIEEIVGEAKEEIFVESPYLVLRKDGIELIEKVLKSGSRFSILTNSLKSTDAYYTSSALALSFHEIENLEMDLYLFEGKNNLSSDKKPSWGIHSKRAVIDDKHTIVGTYNIDPRSANLNSEMIIICRDNPQLARAVLSDIKQRLNVSRQLTGDNYKYSHLTKGASFMKKTKFYLSMPIVYFLTFLL